MASSYENSDDLPERQASVVTGTYSYAKYGQSNEPYQGSSSKPTEEAGVDNINPIYFEPSSKPPSNPQLQQRPPELPPSNQHYNVPRNVPSNNRCIYERMDSFQRIQSPNDPIRPLVSHENTPAIEEDTGCRLTADNPLYNRGERLGSERKQTFSSNVETIDVEYSNKTKLHRCDSKAFMLFLLLLILFIMSAASLILSIMVIITPNGCDRCTASDSSLVTQVHLESVKLELEESLENMNDSFNDLMLSNQGPQGPSGHNGSIGPQGPAGPPGPPATNGSIQLADYCFTDISVCTVSHDGESSCTTPGSPVSTGPTQTVAHWCMVKGDAQSTYTVKSTVLEYKQNTLLGDVNSCSCEVTLSGGGSITCEYTRFSCNFSSIDVSFQQN